MFSTGENSLPQWTRNLVMSNFNLHPSWTNTPWMETWPLWNNCLIDFSVYASNHYDSVHTGTTQPFRTVTNTIYIFKTRGKCQIAQHLFLGVIWKLFVVILWYYIHVYWPLIFTLCPTKSFSVDLARIFPVLKHDRQSPHHVELVIIGVCPRVCRYPPIQPYQQLTNHKPWIFTFGD